MLRLPEVLIGLAIVAYILNDLFHSVVVPRPTPARSPWAFSTGPGRPAGSSWCMLSWHAVSQRARSLIVTRDARARSAPEGTSRQETMAKCFLHDALPPSFSEWEK